MDHCMVVTQTISTEKTKRAEACTDVGIPGRAAGGKFTFRKIFNIPVLNTVFAKFGQTAGRKS
jgi:hypothetical protein